MKALSTFFLLFLSVLAYGQMAIGGSIGIGGHQIYFDPAVNQKVQPHFEYRVGIQYLNDKNSGVSLEMAGSELGWDLDDEDSTYSIDWRQTELRFYSHFNIGKGAHRMPIQLGPYVGYAHKSYPSNDKVRFGLSFGTGYALVFDKNIIQFMIHYRQDLIPIFPVDDYLYSLPQSMTLSIGYYRAL